MKITRRQLKRIIKEARSPNDMAPQIMQDQEDTELMNQYSDIDDYFDGGYDEEDREWIVYSELSGRFEPSGIRDPSELGKIKAYINVNGQAARQHYGSQMSASMMENKMKITRHQLRRIIAEATMMGRSPVAPLPTQKMYRAIVAVLSRSPRMSGSELVDTVNQMHPEIGADQIYDFLDQLIDDGEVFFNVEEDEWSLT